MPMTRLIAVSAFVAAMLAISPAQAEVSSKTRNFITKAAITDMFEIKSSELALKKSEDAEVKDFAQQMIDDHTKSSAELKATLKDAKEDLALLPRDLDPKHAKLMGKLKAVSESEFDKEYLKIQKEGHRDAVKLFREYSEEGDHAALKAFAAKTLPVIEMHKSHVIDLKKKK